MKYTAEAGHWYTRAGEPAYTYENDSGETKKTTLRQARKLDLVPSVTSILGIADKPALTHWKILQAIQATKDIRRSDYEDEGSHLKAVLRESKRVGREAAERGTEIHGMIEKGFKGGFEGPAYLAVRSVLDVVFPDESWQAEESFCSKSGYGGKIDLCSSAGVFVDFKTKDNLAEKTISSLVYDEHGMQLSAYANGMNFLNPERLSIFIDRDDHSVVKFHLWDKESHSRHLEMFEALLKYWQLSKNYNPLEDKK